MMVSIKFVLSVGSGLVLLLVIGNGVYRYATRDEAPSVTTSIALPALAAAWAISMGPPTPIPYYRR